MLKKSLFVGGAAVLLAALFAGRDACSYVGTSAAWVKESVKRSVPIGFEIERARQMIKDLDPEIQQNMHLIAKEEVEVEKLAREVARAEKRIVSAKSGIIRLKADVDSGDEFFVYGGRAWTMQQVKSDLTRRFDRFQTSQATLEKLQKIEQARKSGLEAARQKLEGMLAAKRQLEVDVENLEARQKMVEVAQTTSDFNFDDSHLARTKDLINEIHTRIDVAEKLVDVDQKFHDQIPLDEPEVDENISDRISQYFGESPQAETLVEAH